MPTHSKSRTSRSTATVRVLLASVLASAGLSHAPAGEPAMSPAMTSAGSPDAVTGTDYKATRDMASVLTTLKGLGGKPIETLTPTEARQQPTVADAVNAVLKAKGKDTDPTKLVPGVSSMDTSIPGPAGALPVRVYTPSGSGPFPVIVYFHGGGWVIANKQVYDGGARGLSKASNAVVVSVEYRLAPEAKFPAAWDDALAAYKYVTTHAAEMHGNPGKLALAGERVKVDRKIYKGVTHEFFGTAAVVSEAKDAQAFAGQQLKAAFN